MSTFEDVLNRLEQIFSDQNIYAHGLRREYNRQNRGAGTHNGQLKLWFADLMAFLTYLIDYQQCPKIILVIGAADGEHWTNPEFAERVFTKMGKILAFQKNPIMPLKAVFDLIAQNRENPAHLQQNEQNEQNEHATSVRSEAMTAPAQPPGPAPTPEAGRYNAMRRLWLAFYNQELLRRQ